MGYIRPCVLCEMYGFTIYCFTTFHMKLRLNIVVIGLRLETLGNGIDQVESTNRWKNTKYSYLYIIQLNTVEYN